MNSHTFSTLDRGIALLLGVVVAFGLLEGYHRIGLKGADAALGTETTTSVAYFEGRQLNAWQPTDFEKVWVGKPGQPPVTSPILWLGNSQLHSINQLKKGDAVAPYYASAAVGRPVIGLSLPNANLQELLLVFAWAISKRPPTYAALGVFYDDLREDGLRPELKELDYQETRAILESTAAGRMICEELDALQRSKSDTQGTTASSDSFQDRSETVLTNRLAARWHLWRNRDQMLAALQVKHLYKLRNWVFGITPQTIRPMIPVRFDKNMAALTAIMDLAHRHGVRLLVYVPPLRNDVAPPYDVQAYRRWQNSLYDACTAGSARFAAYGDLVPAEYWGLHGGEIDFMHFQDEGHRRLAAAIVEGLEVNSRPR